MTAAVENEADVLRRALERIKGMIVGRDPGPAAARQMVADALDIATTGLRQAAIMREGAQTQGGPDVPRG